MATGFQEKIWFVWLWAKKNSKYHSPPAPKLRVYLRDTIAFFVSTPARSRPAPRPQPRQKQKEAVDSNFITAPLGNVTQHLDAKFHNFSFLFFFFLNFVALGLFSSCSARA